jgi:ribosomal protein S12 methylthiotransferase accessory factor YcaO
MISKSLESRCAACTRVVGRTCVGQDRDVLLETLRSAGIRHVYVADVSDAGASTFRVVRVIVPELERTRLDCIGSRRLRCVLER